MIKNKKIALLTYMKTCSQKGLNELIHLKYDHIYLISPKELTYKFPKKVTYIYRPEGMKGLNNLLEKLVDEHVNEFLIPFFRGDAMSKYMIFVWSLYGKKVDWRIFKKKDMMNQFVNKIQEKISVALSKKELKLLSYKEIQARYNCADFVIKPLDKSSSIETFKFYDEKSLFYVKNKLIQSNTYILEEYLPGKLYSIDFLCTGTDLLTLSYVKETPVSEWIEYNKYSEDFCMKYGEDLKKYFMYFLPVRYTHDVKNISKTELLFFSSLKRHLQSIGYQGLIHLEYKYDKTTNKIGFIERGARLGGNRLEFIQKKNSYDVRNLMYDVFAKKDISKWEKKSTIGFFKDQHADQHVVGIRTNVIKKTHIYSILSSLPNHFKISYEIFLCDYLKQKRNVVVQEISLKVVPDNNGFLHPSYTGKGGTFIYFLTMDSDSFRIFRKKKTAIAEQLMFHDYN